MKIKIFKSTQNAQHGGIGRVYESSFSLNSFHMSEIISDRMIGNGSMQSAEIGSEMFCNHSLKNVDRFFNRSKGVSHVGNMGLFDLGGEFCFASYLARATPDTSEILPLFLVKMMNSPAYQAEAKGKASKSINQSNINATVMKKIKVPVPSLAEQKKFVAKIEALEKKIADAQAIIDSAPAHKEAVMKKYL